MDAQSHGNDIYGEGGAHRVFTPCIEVKEPLVLFIV
jgi:hypothetical protein